MRGARNKDDVYVPAGFRQCGNQHEEFWCKAQADTDYLGELDISVFYFLPVLSGVDCTCLAIVEESLCSLTDSLNYLLRMMPGTATNTQKIIQ